VRESSFKGYQILSDGTRVWVNAPSGHAVARLGVFGKMVLLDVHGPSGVECLDCSHTARGPQAWNRFVELVWKFHGVLIADDHRPAWASFRR